MVVRPKMEVIDKCVYIWFISGASLSAVYGEEIIPNEFRENN